MVTRICPPIAAQLPGSMALGATHSPELAYETGKRTGETLAYFGINTDYAPVCDINSEPLNPVIGVRSPGDDPDFVGRFASATARGFRQAGIISCAKHFPGHGDTAVDSHYGLPAVTKSRDQLELCEFVPFRRATAEGMESVMTAHIAMHGLPGDEKLPATLSAEALAILREDMQYDGVVVSDCLEMDGVRASVGSERGSALALKAGCDSIMICHTFSVQEAAIKKVCEEVKFGSISMARVEEATRRVVGLKRRFLDWETALRREDPSDDLVLLNRSNEAFANHAYSRSATVVRSMPGVLPLSESCQIILLLPGAGIPAGGAVDGEGRGGNGSYNTTVFVDILRTHNANVTEVRYGTAGLSGEQWDTVAAADAVILVTMNARESEYQESLGLKAPKHAQKLIAIAACSPYDFLENAQIETYITTYEPTAEAFAAAANVIFGKSESRGVLPVGSQAPWYRSFTIRPFEPATDLDQVTAIWQAALPTYAIPKAHLQKLLVKPNAHHLVACVGSAVAGLSVAYTTTIQGNVSGQLAALVVDSLYQKQGIGSALVSQTRSLFRTTLNINQLELTSVFPRFWPGIPKDLPYEVQEFFLHRGSRLSPPDARAVDLYEDIRNYQAPKNYITNAKERGYTFGPLQPEHYDECIAAQKDNFTNYGVSATTHLLLTA